MEHVLAVDLGTGGPKVALVGADGTLTDHVRGATRLMLGPAGAAEQDPDDWWEAVTGCVRRLLDRGAVPPAAVAAVAVTAQWSGTVPVGSDGRHVAPAVIWLDSRGARYIREVTGGRLRVAGYGVRRLRRFLSRAGGLPGHSGKDPTAHILWLRHERRDVYEATRVFLEPGDYLTLRLTGRACASHDSIALHWVTDNRDLGAVRYDEHLLRLSGIDPDRLPELVPSASVVGGLRTAVADEWGLPAGIPVVNATADIHSALLGSGAVADYAGHLYVGTSSWLSCHVPWKRTDLRGNQTTLPSAVPGRYLVANEQETAGACLEWVAAALGEPVGETIALAGRAGPGAGGVVFTPWLNGERTPVDDRTVRGGFHNLGLANDRADLARAVLEGVAFNSRWMLEAVERFIRRPMPVLAFVGGGARSDLWAQIHADVLDRTVRQVADPQQANVRGAAFLALLALGMADLDGLAGRVPVTAEYRPDPGTRDTYDTAYAAFRDLYRRNRGLYRRLNRG